MQILWTCPAKISLYYADSFMYTESLCLMGVSAKVTLCIVLLPFVFISFREQSNCVFPLLKSAKL